MNFIYAVTLMKEGYSHVNGKCNRKYITKLCWGLGFLVLVLGFFSLFHLMYIYCKVPDE